MTLDPRTVVDPIQFGSRLRDAAVDPEPGDFLAPINAGEEGELGNPHGPTVIAPGIHGNQGMHPVAPGPVDGDPAVQDAAEKAHMVAFQPAVSALVVDPDTVELAPDATEEVTATATLIDGVTEADVTADAAWTSDDTDVATVDAGVITAVAGGTCTVTATHGGKTADVAVTVTA